MMHQIIVFSHRQGFEIWYSLHFTCMFETTVVYLKLVIELLDFNIFLRVFLDFVDANTAWLMRVVYIRFQNLKTVGNDEVGLALPFATVSGAAPSEGVAASPQMFVERKIVQSQIDAAIRTQVELDCKVFVSLESEDYIFVITYKFHVCNVE